VVVLAAVVVVGVVAALAQHELCNGGCCWPWLRVSHQEQPKGRVMKSIG
jgi:hypothetical protein